MCVIYLYIYPKTWPGSLSGKHGSPWGAQGLPGHLGSQARWTPPIAGALGASEASQVSLSGHNRDPKWGAGQAKDAPIHRSADMPSDMVFTVQIGQHAPQERQPSVPKGVSKG